MEPHCSVCGATEPGTVGNYSEWVGLPSGDGSLCLSCAQMHEVGQLRDRSQPYVGYVSRDGQLVTGWLGNRLMDVVQTRQVRSNWWHVGQLTYVLARDVHGAWWYGRGAGRGMCITMRPRKVAPPSWVITRSLPAVLAPMVKTL